jgi:uncharacterized protein (TIGR00369 family)
VTSDPLRALRLGLGRDGRAVPAHDALGIRMVDVGAGTATVRMASGPLVADAAGTMLPGALSVIADTCCGSAIAGALSGEGTTVTAQMRLEFVRPVPAGTRWVTARGEADVVDDEGGLARGELLDDREELLAVTSMRALRTVDGPAKTDNGRRPSGTPALRAVHDHPPMPDLPVHALMGVTDRVVEAGRATWTLVPDQRTANSFEAMHGGVVALMAHLVATDAQRSVLAPDERLAPLDLVVNYYRAVGVGSSAATASAEVTHRGRRFVVAEGEATTADGRTAVRFSVGGQIRRFEP